jgi:hypothetical protein
MSTLIKPETRQPEISICIFATREASQQGLRALMSFDEFIGWEKRSLK